MLRTIDLLHPVEVPSVEMAKVLFDDPPRIRINGRWYYLHHSATAAMYAAERERYRYYPYEGSFGIGYVHFVPIKGQRGNLCTIEYWIAVERGTK